MSGGASHIPFTEKFPPSCRFGFTQGDLESYFGAKRGETHPLWTQLRGQTGLICEGKECQKAHGFVSYVSDVQEWYEGRPVNDW